MKSLTVLNEVGFNQQQKTFILNNFSKVQFFNDTFEEQVAIQRAFGSNIIVFDQFMLNIGEQFFRNCKKLELLIINTTAFNNVDLELLEKYNVKLANLRDYATRDVAETGVTMVMMLNNKTNLGNRLVEETHFVYEDYVHESPVYDLYPGHKASRVILRRQLKNQVAGIIGLGRIGQEAASMFLALGMPVIGFNRTVRIIPSINIVPLSRLFKEADIIFVSMAYENSTQNNYINAELLNVAKEHAILVSISHPNLIDISFLIKNPNKFYGIGFDYLVTKEIIKYKQNRRNNIIITPNLGSQSVEAYKNMTNAIIDAAVSFSLGVPLYLVN